MADDWYRKKSWTGADEKDFFERLARARETNRPQYLKVQAIELVETKDKKLLDVAEMLFNKLLVDYPADKFNKPGSLHSLGDIYKLRNNNNKAIEYYKKALDFEIGYPQVQTQAYLDYSELIVKTGKTELYSSVEQTILKKLPSLLFPIEKYKCCLILAAINKQNGDITQYKNYEELAEKHASEKTSGLRYHNYLGIVKDRNHWLDRLLKRKRFF